MLKFVLREESSGESRNLIQEKAMLNRLRRVVKEIYHRNSTGGALLYVNATGTALIVVSFIRIRSEKVFKMCGY